MQAYTAAYKTAVQKGALIGCQLQILKNGVAVSNPYGQYLPIIDGAVDDDYTATTRRTCTIQFDDPQGLLVPTGPSSLLAPYGNEIQVQMGPMLANGTFEYKPMGIFYLSQSNPSDSGMNIVMMLRGVDRAGRLSRLALTSPLQIAAGTNVATAISTILNNQWPSSMPALRYNMSPTGYTVPLINLDVNQDPWGAASDIATAAGMDLYFDPNGIVTMTPTPQTSTFSPSWRYSDTNGGYGYMINTLAVDLTNQKVYSSVIVTSETVDGSTTLTSVAQDTDPNSPTYINGPFGNVPLFLKTSIVTSQAQLDAMAQAQLQLVKGRAQQVTITGPPNPAQNAQDGITVVRSRLGINGGFFIDKVETKLSSGKNAGAQIITARSIS